MYRSSSGLAGVIATWTGGTCSDSCAVPSGAAITTDSLVRIGGGGMSLLRPLVRRGGKGGGVGSAAPGVPVIA